MATEMVEYRPGKWVKVVDGQTVGRVTPAEVAAWQQAGGRTTSYRPAAPPSGIELDVDLSPGRPSGPAHSLDVPLRPAYERRRPRQEPEQPQPTGLEVDLDTPPAAARPRPTRLGPAQAARPPMRRAPRSPLTPAADDAIASRAEAPAHAAKAPAPAGERPAAPQAATAAKRPPRTRRVKAKPPAGEQPAKRTTVSKEPPTPKRRATAGDGEETTATARKAPKRKRPPSGATGDGATAKKAPTRTRRTTAGSEERAPAPKKAPARRRRKAEPAAEEAQANPAAEPEQAAEPERGPRYWWIWNVHGQPVATFLREWAPRYKEKFGREVNIILCHEDELEAVEACGYEGEVSPLLQPGHFYLGHEGGG